MSQVPVPVVKVEGVSKQFSINRNKSLKERVLNPLRSRQYRQEFSALRNVTISIDAGSTVGLIGPNGSGKSTLLKIIGGILRASSGTVATRGRLAALLELGAGFHPDLTGRENVYLNASILGLSSQQVDERFDSIVDFSEIGAFIDTQVKFYSSGMYVRLAFAVAIHVDPDVLLVDEVLAVGDEAFQKKCLDRIHEFQLEGRTIILVTHTLSQVTSLCTRAIVLARGSVVFDGSPLEAVSVLRSGYRDVDAAAGLATPDHGGEHGAIESVRLVDEQGTVRESFVPGEVIGLEISAEAAIPLPRWGIGVHVANAFGQLIAGTTSFTMGTELQDLVGVQTVRLLLRDMNLGAGEYGVTVALYEGDSDHEIARVTEAVWIKVVDPGHQGWGPARATYALERVH